MHYNQYLSHEWDYIVFICTVVISSQTLFLIQTYPQYTAYVLHFNIHFPTATSPDIYIFLLWTPYNSTKLPLLIYDIICGHFGTYLMQLPHNQA
jgi:hypothetical protein